MARPILKQPAVVSLLLLFFCLAIYQAHIADVQYPIIGKGVDIDQLPNEYGHPTTQSQFCENRFGRDYLVRFQKNVATYCENGSTSQLSCFSNHVDPKGETSDTFCIGGPAVFEPQTKKFGLGCQIRDIPSDETALGVVPFQSFAKYLYDTGPSFILNQFVDFTSAQHIPSIDSSKAPIAILVKREAMWQDTWHGLLDIMSTYLTLDVLRMAINPITNNPYFSNSDFDNSQVILLDDSEDGPYVDLWNLFARKPILRISNLTDTGTSTNYSKIITPLPGVSNTLWQGDWQLLDCHKSSLLTAFSNRVLYAYNIPTTIKTTSPQSRPSPIQLIFINRLQNRRLLQANQYFYKLQQNYPITTLHIHIMNYTTLPFPDQLRITHATADILIGVHSDSLTHTMFLRPGSAVVEIMPFDNTQHVGFANMANMMDDVQYFRTVSLDDPVRTGATGDWREDDVWVDEEAFLGQIGKVVEEMAKRKGWCCDMFV